MFVYRGRFIYTTSGSWRRGESVEIELVVSIFSPRITVTISDDRYQTRHALSNTRYDFKSRDSNVDLMARDSWASDWYDSFRGDAQLIMPTIHGVPTEIAMVVIASWDPAFCVIEFQLGEDHCQFATRPRPGTGRWWRRIEANQPQQRPLPPTIPESTRADSSTRAGTQEASSTASTASMPPLEPIQVNFGELIKPS